MKWFNCIKQCFVVVFVLLLFANVLCIGCFDCNGVFEEKSFAKIEPVSVSIGVGMQPVQSGGIYFCNIEQVSGEKAKGGSLLWDDQNLVASMVGDFASDNSASEFEIGFKNTSQNTLVLCNVLSDKMQVVCNDIDLAICPEQTCCVSVVVFGGAQNARLDFCFARQ